MLHALAYVMCDVTLRYYVSSQISSIPRPIYITAVVTYGSRIRLFHGLKLLHYWCRRLPNDSFDGFPLSSHSRHRNSPLRHTSIVDSQETLQLVHRIFTL